MTKINDQVKQAVQLQTIEDILNVNQIEYRRRLTDYFSRVKVTDINFDVLHDINGLKHNDEHFLPRL
tara:strand:+ start:851 stop:1051 length:201 start_codon:yes stop_codon:yes gene_type:complete